ncbi:methylmalonyl-CoA mutase family protein [Jeotgalibacillus malaysiensis]|uniref:methylmalonyl-CoA mutase family protein n=1 Tax=Jeotgalibacillus malaysiensis TaxID=1508404 RepID=UPI00384D05F3
MTLKDTEFPASSFDEWTEQVKKVLKGKPVDSLNIELLEGLTVNPLYTDRPDITDTHISRGWKSKAQWMIAQQANGESAEELIRSAKEELIRGSEVAALNEHTSSLFNSEQASDFLGLDNQLHIYITYTDLKPWLSALQKADISGIIGKACSGPDLDEDWFNDIIEIDKIQPELKTIILSGLPVHRKGGNTVQELAFILAQANRVIQLAEKSGWSAEKVISKMHAEFGIGSNFFLEIAKLRAFRAIWRHFTEQYQVDSPITISTETSPFTKLTQDEHTNMLRSGNESFAAVLGGTDYLYVRPYDCYKNVSSGQAVRAARNIGLILKEEMFLQNVIDPSGGSYYIEHLTKELAEKSWSELCELEERGGLTSAYHQLMSDVQKIRDQRDQGVRTRKHTLVGMNKYAPADKNRIENIPETAGYAWDVLIQKVQNNPVKKIGLLTVGELKDYKPRADFVKGVFAGAGVVPDYDQDQADVLIVCGSDAAYDQYLAEAIQSKKADQKIFIAGKREAEGLDGSLFNGMDMVSFLEDVLFAGIGGDHHEA